MAKRSKMLFSQRRGIKPLKTALQIDSMDDDLRNSLWNILYEHFLVGSYSMGDDPFEMEIYRLLLQEYFKKPLDTLSSYRNKNNELIKQYFFNCEWFEVYDLLEFVVNEMTIYSDTHLDEFIKKCNGILERELSTYRLVGGRFTQITSMEEISELEEALSYDFMKPVNIHLKHALSLLADKKNPDYRNSIKESISAVESICKLITNKPRASLGEALKEIEKRIEIHGSLKVAFEKLYGYTCNAEGIRHALMDKSDLNFEDAKFMLVACSSFINYLVQKAIKSDIKFS